MCSFNMCLNLSEYTAFAHSALTSEHLYDVFVYKWRYTFYVVRTVDKSYHKDVFYKLYLKLSANIVILLIITYKSARKVLFISYD